MLNFLNGNIFNSDAYALVNTVNTVGVMGKGIALKFKQEFSYNYQQYREAFLINELAIGKLLCVKDTSLFLGERLIINLPTKTHWRLPSEYSYIEQGLIALAQLITDRHVKHIALPALGCGNGGLDWSTVQSMIVRYLSEVDAQIDIYPPVY